MAKGYERWKAAMSEVARSLVIATERDAERNKLYLQRFTKLIVGTVGPEDNPPDNFSPLMAFQSKLFWAYVEIDQTIEALQNIETYIGSFPYTRNKKVKKSAHLAYHFENSMHETYLLQQRLEAFTKLVAKAYRKDARHAQIAKLMTALAEFVEVSLKPVIHTRGSHVHASRFDHVDFYRLRILEHIETNPISDKLAEALPGYHKIVYRELRSKWRKVVKDNNKEIANLMDGFGDAIVDAIHTGPNGALAAPVHLIPKKDRG